MESHDLFLELQQKSRANLLGFLQVELALIATLRDVAKSESDPEHREQTRAHIAAAIKAIRHFVERVDDAGVRGEIEAKTDRLEKEIAADFAGEA